MFLYSDSGTHAVKIRKSPESQSLVFVLQAIILEVYAITLHVNLGIR